MIVDTSAVIAIVFGEAQTPRLLERLAVAPLRRISAANLLETYMVVDRSPVPDSVSELQLFLGRARLRIEPVTHAQVELARIAFRDYGRGSRHAARLNFGDCFSYSLAKLYGEPLLFVGEDFTATDIEPALLPS